MKTKTENADRYHAEAKAPSKGGSFPTPQQVVVLPVDVLDEKLEELATRLEDRLRGSPCERDELLSAKQVMDELHISPKKFQTMRNERRIQFSQIGRKIYVKRSDLNAYIENHTINPKIN